MYICIYVETVGLGHSIWKTTNAFLKKILTVSLLSSNIYKLPLVCTFARYSIILIYSALIFFLYYLLYFAIYYDLLCTTLISTPYPPHSCLVLYISFFRSLIIAFFHPYTSFRMRAYELRSDKAHSDKVLDVA